MSTVKEIGPSFEDFKKHGNVIFIPANGLCKWYQHLLVVTGKCLIILIACLPACLPACLSFLETQE